MARKRKQSNKQKPPTPPPRRESLPKGSSAAGKPVVNRVHAQKDSGMVVGANGIAQEYKFSSSESTLNHPKHGKGVRVVGRELIANLQLTTPSPTGTTLLNWDVSPSNILGTRIAALSQLYEKYRFKVLQFEWEPEVGSNQAGKVVLSYDPDCLDATPPASFDGIRALTSFANAKLSTVWKPTSIRIVNTEDQLLYTNEQPGSDARFVYQGQFYLANAGSTTLTGSLGSIALAFELEFYKPALEQTGASVDQGVSLSTPFTARDTAAPNNMFNIQTAATLVTNVVKQAGGIQQLIDALGNIFFRVPPGKYRADLSTFEPIKYSSVASDLVVNPPIVTAVLPPVAPAGSTPPTVTLPYLEQLPFTRVADAGSANPINYAATSSAAVINAPSGADIYGTLGPASNAAWPLTGFSPNPVYSWEIDRIFGSQAIA